jgi:hypothetical protein
MWPPFNKEPGRGSLFASGKNLSPSILDRVMPSDTDDLPIMGPPSTAFITNHPSYLYERGLSHRPHQPPWHRFP